MYSQVKPNLTQLIITQLNPTVYKQTKHDITQLVITQPNPTLYNQTELNLIQPIYSYLLSLSQLCATNLNSA